MISAGAVPAPYTPPGGVPGTGSAQVRPLNHDYAMALGRGSGHCDLSRNCWIPCREWSTVQSCLRLRFP